MFNRRGRAILPFCLAAISLSSPSGAASLIGLDALTQWNLIVFDGLNTTGSVQGRSFVGGDVRSDGGVFYGSSVKVPKDGADPKSEADPKVEGEVKQPAMAEAAHKEGAESAVERDPGKGTPPKSSNAALTVAGNLLGGATIDNGGGADVGGSVEARLKLIGETQTVNAGGKIAEQDFGENKINAELGEDFTSTLLRQRELLMESLNVLSGDLSKLEATAKVDAKEAQMVFQANEGLNVFNVSLADLEKLDAISVTAADGSTTVINVSGEAGNLSARFLGGTTELSRNIIWNFYEARDLTFGSAMFGTLLAGGAQVTLSDYVAGTVVAAALANSGSIRSAGFQGSLASTSPTEIVSAAPEPATWAMLIGGFLMVGFVMRRRAALTAARA